MRKVPSYTGFTPASADASRVKRNNRTEGGRAEQLLRQTLWRQGLRYRKHVDGLPGRPDLVFPRARLCVFVDGDFWHGRDWPQLRQRLLQRANRDYWIPKIQRNLERDREQTAALTGDGWRVLRFWETDVLADPTTAASHVSAAIHQPPLAIEA